jgi:hypothetical protein
MSQPKSTTSSQRGKSPVDYTTAKWIINGELHLCIGQEKTNNAYDCGEITLMRKTAVFHNKSTWVFETSLGTFAIFTQKMNCTNEIQQRFHLINY